MSTQIDSLEIKIATTLGDSAVDVEKLAEKLEKLQDVLSDLNKTLNKIGGHAKVASQMDKLSSATDKATRSTKSFGSGLKSLDLFATIQNMQDLAMAVNFVMDAFSAALSQAIEWDSVQARFGRAMGDSAEKYYQYIQKVNEELGINIQQFMANSSLFADMMRGFGVNQGDAATMAVGFTELAYDIWAGTNDVFNTLEDAMQAVRSTIGGETESIQRAGFSVIESTLKETAARHGLAVNIEKATMAEKTYLRYLTLVDQAHARSYVGVYAAEMQTAEGAIRSLTQSFKTLVQAFGSLFIPILQVAIPYLTAFVEILTDAVGVVAKFFGIELFKIDWSNSNKGVGGIAESATEAATGLGDATKAAKKLRDYTMGFDELNVINPDTGSGSSAGAGGVGGNGDWMSGLDLDTLWDESVLAQASKRVDEIKQNILDFYEKWDWAILGATAILSGFAYHKAWTVFKNSTMFTGVVAAFKKVTDTFSDFVKLIKNGEPILGKLATTFPKLTNAVTKLLTPVKAVATYFGMPLWAAFTAIVATIGSVVYFLYENWEEVTKAVKKFFKENIVPKLEEIKKHLDKVSKSLEPLGELFEYIGEEVMPMVGKVFETVGGIIFTTVGGIIASAFNTLVAQIENAVQIFSGVVEVVSGVIELIVAVFTGGDTEQAWKKIWDGVITIIKGVVGAITAPVIELVNGIIGWFSSLYTELTGKELPNIVEGVKKWFSKLPTNIDTALDNAWTFVKDFFKISKWQKLVEDAIATIKKHFKMPTLPKIKLDVTYSTNVSKVKKLVYEALGLSGWPSLKWSAYDQGGFPAMGEMFIAREAGPELVGRIGNKSTVANNDQIVTAVAQGVYDAVRAAMGETSGNSGSQNINVYLDSRQIHASVKRTDEARGANIMGNQLGYLY